MKIKIALQLFAMFLMSSIWQSNASSINTVAPPVNDDCSGAISLTINPNFLCANVTSGTVAEATASTAPNACSSNVNANDDVWFKFVATATAHRIEINGIIASVGVADMYHMVYDGGTAADCAALGMPILCSDPEMSNLNASTSGNLTIGNTYFIRVFTNSATAGNATFTICVGSEAMPPANDACANAQVLTTFPHQELVDASAATNNDGFITASGCIDTNDGVWYTYTAQDDKWLSIIVSPSGGWNSSIAAYSGTCGALTCVDSSNPGGNGVVETLDFAMTAGVTYFINIAYPSGTVDSPEGIFNISINKVLSVDDIIAKGFYYYPNPVKNTLKVTANEPINQISIYTVLGREIKKLSEKDLADFNSEIDFSKFPRGAYFVRAVVGGESGVFKVVKE